MLLELGGVTTFNSVMSAIVWAWSNFIELLPVCKTVRPDDRPLWKLIHHLFGFRRCRNACGQRKEVKMSILSVQIRTALLLRALYTVASPTIYTLRDTSAFCRLIDTRFLLVNRSTCRKLIRRLVIFC